MKFIYFLSPQLPVRRSFVLYVQLVRVITGNSTVRLPQKYGIFRGPEALLPLPMAKKKKSKP